VQNDMGLEAPDADAAEQDQDVMPEANDTEEVEAENEDVPLEANEADLLEQGREVNLDDDEYR
jgi:hypothetical protein